MPQGDSLILISVEELEAEGGYGRRVNLYTVRMSTHVGTQDHYGVDELRYEL